MMAGPECGCGRGGSRSTRRGSNPCMAAERAAPGGSRRAWKAQSGLKQAFYTLRMQTIALYSLFQVNLLCLTGRRCSQPRVQHSKAAAAAGGCIGLWRPQFGSLDLHPWGTHRCHGRVLQGEEACGATGAECRLLHPQPRCLVPGDPICAIETIAIVIRENAKATSNREPAAQCCGRSLLFRAFDAAQAVQCVPRPSLSETEGAGERRLFFARWLVEWLCAALGSTSTAAWAMPRHPIGRRLALFRPWCSLGRAPFLALPGPEHRSLPAPEHPNRPERAASGSHSCHRAVAAAAAPSAPPACPQPAPRCRRKESTYSARAAAPSATMFPNYDVRYNSGGLLDDDPRGLRRVQAACRLPSPRLPCSAWGSPGTGSGAVGLLKSIQSV